MSEAAEVVAPEAPVAPPPAATPPAATPAASTGETPAQNTAAEATAAPAGEKPKTDEQPAKPGKSRFERRLDRAYRERAEAKARAEFLEKQLAEYQKPKEAPGAPRLEDFDDIEKYASAKAKYEADNALKAHTQQQRAAAAKAAQERMVASWEAKAARAEDKYPDFDEKVGELSLTDAQGRVNPLVHAIMDCENAEDVAYHLATHPEDAQKLREMDSPLAQIRYIGRLEAKLLAEPVKPKTPSKAPAPISPVGARSGGASDMPQDTDDIGTWMKKANALDRQKKAAGR